MTVPGTHRAHQEHLFSECALLKPAQLWLCLALGRYEVLESVCQKIRKQDDDCFPSRGKETAVESF